MNGVLKMVTPVGIQIHDISVLSLLPYHLTTPSEPIPGFYHHHFVSDQNLIEFEKYQNIIIFKFISVG